MGIYLDEEFEKDWRRFISEKYQTVQRGLLSHEVEQAMKHWYALHTKSQKSLLDKAPNPMPRVSNVYMQMKRYLLSKYFDELNPGATIPYKYLREAIQQTRGSDKRTITKWLKTFVQNGLLRQLNASVWELIS